MLRRTVNVQRNDEFPVGFAIPAVLGFLLIVPGNVFGIGIMVFLGVVLTPFSFIV